MRLVGIPVNVVEGTVYLPHAEVSLPLSIQQGSGGASGCCESVGHWSYRDAPSSTIARM
jgi:hypothetical protein